MVKIIYLDIDGTLRDEKLGIPRSALQAVGQCRKHGIQIVICTGRNAGAVQDDVLALETDGMISGGGCYIQYHGKEIFRKHFSTDVLKKALSAALDRRLSLSVETEQKIYMDHNAALFYREDFQRRLLEQGKGSQERMRKGNKIPYEENFGQLQREVPEAHKICMFGEQTTIEDTEKDLREDTETIQKKEWNGSWYLELLPKGCHKGSAVRMLNRELGIPREQSMSFGDGENDITMLAATGISVAVGCASPGMEKYISSVCEPVMEDGIFKELLRRRIITISGGAIWGSAV